QALVRILLPAWRIGDEYHFDPLGVELFRKVHQRTPDRCRAPLLRIVRPGRVHLSENDQVRLLLGDDLFHPRSPFLASGIRLTAPTQHDWQQWAGRLGIARRGPPVLRCYDVQRRNPIGCMRITYQYHSILPTRAPVTARDRLDL